jgi:hypothetical protein
LLPRLLKWAGKLPLPPPRPPRVKTGGRSPPEWREALTVDWWLPEEEPDSERFLLPPAVEGEEVS